MPKQSAGILLYRLTAQGPEVLLVHPGGPFFKNKDLGSWSIPKGEFAAPELPLDAAQRECREELSFCPPGPFTPLTPIKQKSGKIVHAFAVKSDFDPANLKSNTFQIPWPPNSKTLATFPEIDGAQWFSLAEAHQKILPAQAPLLHQLQLIL